MTLQCSTLRPGLLVSLKTSIRGNVKWDRRDIEREYVASNGARVAKWETERTIADPEEFKRAQEVRAQAGGFVRSVCARSTFGLLCPETAADKLEAAITDARALADEFNTNAKLTRVNIYIIAGRIEPNDIEATRAINGEVRDLLADMERGLSNLDVRTVRAAAARAKSIGRMLSPDAAARIQTAVDAARASARRIVGAGEQVAQEIDQATIKRIAEQRVAFLDLEEPKELAAPTVEARALDLEPAAE